MVIIQEVLVNKDVLEEKFACKLDACKGACCWEGDWGAPLDTFELQVLEKEYPAIASYLDDEGRDTIKQKGTYHFFEQVKEYGTPLKEGGACAYLVLEPNGIAKCGIEKAYEAGATSFPKPISCHLYPVRVLRDQHGGFEHLRYDRWDICNPACKQGADENIRVFEFVREGLIRKYGAEWFAELEAAAKHLDSNQKDTAIQ